jgi:hypothetical protein
MLLYGIEYESPEAGCLKKHRVTIYLLSMQ